MAQGPKGSAVVERAVREGEAGCRGVARGAGGVGVTDSVTGQRKRERIRRLFMPPAKTPTPDNNAESAIITSYHDKQAENAYLARMLETARWNRAGHHKSAKSSRKLGFSVDPCQ